MLDIKINNKIYYNIVLSYIYIPVCIFLCGFVKPVFSIVTIMTLMFCAYKFYKSIKENEIYNVKINIMTLLIIICTVTFIMYCLGYGGFKEQSSDWYKHNGVLMDLMKKTWPVYYINGKEHSMLSYYVGGYMIPAVIGKLCHNSFGIAMMVTWIYIEIGLILAYIGVIKYLKVDKNYMQVMCLFIFIFCFGLQGIGKMIIRYFDESLYEKTLVSFFFSSKLQYSSNLTIIRWVPMQGIIAWLVMLIFLENKDKIKYYVYMALPLVMYGIFPFIGVVTFMFIYAIYKLIIEKDKWSIIKEVFSIENVIEILTFGTILVLYFYGNAFGDKPKEMGFAFVGINKKVLIFMLFMVVPYVMLLYKNYKNNIFYWISVLTLLVLPLMKMGVFNDLMMRSSIPALFMIVLFSIDMINKSISEFLKDKKIKVLPILLILCIIVGSYTPIAELIESANTKSKIIRYDTMQTFATKEGYHADNGIYTLVYNYFAYDIDDNIFYKYVARTKDNKYKKVKSGKVDTNKRK